MTTAERNARNAAREARIAADYRSAARAFIASGREATEEQLQDFVASRYGDCADARRARASRDDGTSTRYWLHVIDGVRDALAAMGVKTELS
jgi:hypothetical protein